MIDLTQFKTWPDAATWLAKHGYGLGSIELLKNEWDDKTKATKVTATKTETNIINSAVKSPASKPAIKTEPVSTTKDISIAEQKTE